MVLSTPRIAVVGGGLAGTCAALELAEHGADVDLYDAGDEILAGASYWCEGKVHLGFVYALDTSLCTARTMVRGAAGFYRVLSRYLSDDELAAATSSPFIYAVPRDSMLPVAAVTSHFAAVGELVRGHPGCLPSIPPPGPTWRRLGTREHASLFDPDLVVASFTTVETAVDPHVIARALRRAVVSSSRIAVRTSTPVTAFGRTDGGRLRVLTTAGEQAYDGVVNAAWQGRPGLDATLGVSPAAPVIHRYKVGLHGPALPETVPSVTFLVGPYGDVVRFADRSYLSWYPTGLLHQTTDVVPPASREVLERVDGPRIARQSARSLGRLLPGAAPALDEAATRATIAGGWITAWGATGIDDPSSRLHERHAVGVTRHGSLISLDTGKFTTAPLFGHEAAHAILDG